MNNRTRGHNLERQVARDLKSFFPYIKTARASSKLLDDCGVDINGVPFLIQCKVGYDRHRPKFEEEYQNIRKNTSVHYPENHSIQSMPVILVHKLNCNVRGKARPEEFHQVTLSYDFFLYLLNNLKPEVIEKWPNLLV